MQEGPSPPLRKGERGPVPRILVVTGDGALGERAASIPSLPPHERQTASSGAEALLAARTAPVDLVLSEISLPDMDGLTLARRMRGEEGTRHVPVILSVKEEPEEHVRVEASSIGLCDFVSPATPPEDLRARVLSCLDAHRPSTPGGVEEMSRDAGSFRRLVQTAKDAIVVVGSKGRIRYWNGAAERMFGYAAPEMIGETLDRVVPERLRGPHHEGMGRVIRGERELKGDFIHETTGVKRDGGEFPVEISIASMPSRGEVLLTGVIRDVSARRAAEAELRRNEEKYRRLVENLNEGVWAIDEREVTTFVNSTMAAMLGYSREEMLGTHLFTFMGEKAAATARENLKRRRLGESGRMEFEFLRKDGAPVVTILEVSPLFDEKGNYCGSLAAVRDISAWKRADDLLRESEERFRALFESSQNMIAISEADGRVVWTNPAWDETLGGGGAGTWVHADRIHPADRDGFIAAWEGVLAGAEEMRNLEYRYSKGDGTFLSLDTNLRALTVSGRRQIYLIGRDISELVRLRSTLRKQDRVHGMVGQDEKMLRLFETIMDLAEDDAPVLIQGESGTGKELVAEAIHRRGPRSKFKFVPVNCSALPDGLLESELFGHIKGAFTGAVRDRRGRFELADGGTIFIDEVAELSQAMQVKLLRVLQSMTFERVGGERTIKVDVRVISATNKNLAREAAAGRFRDDLFYRLSVVPVEIPALRDRPMDIPLLTEHFLRRELKGAREGAVRLSPAVIATLLGYHWPGNVRELENVLRYALIKCKGGVVEVGHLPAHLRGPGGALPAKRGRRRKLIRATVEEALGKADGNKVRAARLLGVSRATLYRFLETL